MEPTADPAALDAAARQLRALARQLETGGTTASFGRQASASKWGGRAARDFQTAVKDDVSKARGLSGELNAIAGLIEDGARKVRQIRAEQAKAIKAAADHGVPIKPLAAMPQ